MQANLFCLNQRSDIPAQGSFSIIRYSKCQHTDTHPFHIPKRISARRSGGSGSQHIIHQQDMLSGKAFGIVKAEHAVHILPPLIRRLACLRLRMPFAHHRRSIQGKTGNRCNPPGYILALVVPAYPLFTGMQRNGHYNVYTRKKPDSSSSAAIKRPIISPKSLRPPYFSKCSIRRKSLPF